MLFLRRSLLIKGGWFADFANAAEEEVEEGRMEEKIEADAEIAEEEAEENEGDAEEEDTAYDPD